MSSPSGESKPYQHASPVSALSPHDRTDGSDRDANAPEAVDAAMTPTTFIASPATDYSHPQTTTSSHADDTEEGAKEVFMYDKSEKMTVPTAYEYQSSPYPQVVGGQQQDQEQGGAAQHNAARAPAYSGKELQAKILGLKRRTFFILLVIACVIVALAVGGGVGGALAPGKHNSSSPATDPVATKQASVFFDTSSESSPMPSSTTIPPATPPSSTTPSSTPRATPTFLNQTNTGSGHFFQGFSQPNMTGNHTDIVSDVAEADFAFDVRSYQFVARNTNCCLSFCTNATAAGWLGYVCASRTQREATEVFSRVFVWCSDKRTAAVARGRCAE